MLSLHGGDYNQFLAAKDKVHLCLVYEAFCFMHYSKCEYWDLSVLIVQGFFLLEKDIYLAVFNKSSFAVVDKND